ncbi:MAG: LysR family transcriptional regulator [Hahellaceae bacterium]|nr:LysR family transcriptional regulator [Hahellaceae bacterium]
MDKIQAMHSFVAVAKHGSFTKAADQTGLSRLQVTRHIQELESWLAQRLLHRTTRKVTLTSAGEQALAHCQAILLQTQQLTQAADAQQQLLSGNLRIAAPIGLTQQWLLAPVQAFCRLHPQVRIDLFASDSNTDLVQERIDIALRFTQQPDPNLIARRLMRVDSVVCAAPGYLASATPIVRPQDLADHPCLVHLQQQQWQFFDREQPISVAVSGPVRANELQTLLQLAILGLGVVRIPCDLANPLLASNQLCRILPGYALPHYSLWAVYLSRDYQAPVVRAFIDFIIADYANDIMAHEITAHDIAP